MPEPASAGNESSGRSDTYENPPHARTTGKGKSFGINPESPSRAERHNAEMLRTSDSPEQSDPSNDDAVTGVNVGVNVGVDADACLALARADDLPTEAREARGRAACPSRSNRATPRKRAEIAPNADDCASRTRAARIHGESASADDTPTAVARIPSRRIACSAGTPGETRPAEATLTQRERSASAGARPVTNSPPGPNRNTA